MTFDKLSGFMQGSITIPLPHYQTIKVSSGVSAISSVVNVVGMINEFGGLYHFDWQMGR